jgi:histidyl-tRNA synthetase
VPFARYVLEHSGKLEFPFRRYQIQPAWRGERPQEGRYRQFTQVDIDVIGRDELPFHHDVEVVRVMAEALATLPLPPLSIQVNNRKLIQGFYRGLGIPDVTAAIRQIDKLDKLPREEVGRLLVADAGASPEQAEPLPRAGDDPRPGQLLRRPGPSPRRRGRAAGDRAAGAGRGRRRLRRCRHRARHGRGQPPHRPRPRLLHRHRARGLHAGYERLKSVAGGGRYDALASDGRTTYPGVGISFGVSRTLIPLFADGALGPGPKVPERGAGRPGRREVTHRQ